MRNLSILMYNFALKKYLTMPEKNSINNDLKEVNNLLRKNIIKEKTISNLYDYIFKKNGKQLRARLSLISSSVDRTTREKKI
jgi:octaprenyl-diphosphate synthase